ncbi:Transcription factor MYB3R-3 [Hondaea fermentalgiana]|uniref:Transcription factor MYB3R-3 n=1 Tax=Hondaea fermentalgiana TaxID=2315210 RepID=A0A2R5GV40_9STRA|nr:Transcription factor MYB3R-3 [Hondaea fermentalgiana]|eukprot:GBG34189.1 Transcription factor MYB3R-3 [Hondaea fermentalgiana]
MAEAGRLLLEGMSISGIPGLSGASSSSSSSSSAAADADSKRMTKRQLSNGTYNNAAPAPQFQRVSFLGARKPGVVPRMWTAAEDEALRAAVAKHGEKSWRNIAEEIEGRNHLQCLQRWKKALRPGLVKGQWTKEEDVKLLELIKPFTEKGNVSSVNWQAISQQIHGRNAKQCRERWFLNLDPSINRGPWTPAEDRCLLELAAQFGGRWSLISKNMEGRTENMVKTRYQSLQRQEARSRGWTESEDNTLVQAAMMFGRNWTKISKQLPGRSKGQVRKRFSQVTQNRPDIVQQIENIEEQIQSGRIDVPDLPPAPIQPIATTSLPHTAALISNPNRGNPNGMYGSQPQQQQQQNPVYGAPSPPQSYLSDFGIETFKPQQPSYQQQAPQPPQQQSADRQKGMFRKYGSSWMAGIADNLDVGANNGSSNNGPQLSSYPSSFGNIGSLPRTNSQKIIGEMFRGNEAGADNLMSQQQQGYQQGYSQQQQQQQRQDPNFMLLDKFLMESGPSSNNFNSSNNNNNAQVGNNDMPEFPPSLGGEAPPLNRANQQQQQQQRQQQQQQQKGLRAYNSWGSVGGVNSSSGNDFAQLFSVDSNMGSFGGPTKSLQHKMSSSNWGSSLQNYESTGGEMKNLLTML